MISLDSFQVQIEVEAQRVRFDDPVVVELEPLTGEVSEDAEPEMVAKQQGEEERSASRVNEQNLAEVEEVTMRTSSNNAISLKRPCSRDADTEDANEDEEEEEEEDSEARQPLLKNKSSTSQSERNARTHSSASKPSSVANQRQSGTAQKLDLSSPDSPKEGDALLEKEDQSPSDPSSPSTPSSPQPPPAPIQPTPPPNANNSEDAKETDALLRHSSSKSFSSANRQRQISETQTFNSDVSAAETDTLSHQTESETAGGWDISNRVRKWILYHVIPSLSHRLG